MIEAEIEIEDDINQLVIDEVSEFLVNRVYKQFIPLRVNGTLSAINGGMYDFIKEHVNL
jgi:hypothetical protein